MIVLQVSSPVSIKAKDREDAFFLMRQHCFAKWTVGIITTLAEN